MKKLPKARDEETNTFFQGHLICSGSRARVRGDSERSERKRKEMIIQCEPLTGYT